MIKVPLPLRADAYTIGSTHVSPEAMERSVYHIVARKGMNKIHPFAKDSRLIFCGLRTILEQIVNEPITLKDIEESDEFIKTFHTGKYNFRWNKDMWVRIVKERNGILPLRIEAPSEGSVVFPYEPIVQITAEGGFGEIAAHFESSLVKIWAPIERVTTLRWWHEWLKDEAKKIHPEKSDHALYEMTQWMFHDFGDRAGICPEESDVLGMSHLLVGPGTDTTSGAYIDWVRNFRQPFGGSIHALAHRTVMGFEHELEAHRALYELGKKTGITAHVSDTYDFFHAVEELCAMTHPVSTWGSDKNTVVIRPDSGDPWECILHILKTCEKYGLYKTLSNGLKTATRIRWIQGDSMTWESMQAIIGNVIKAGWDPFTSGAFGIGGHLRNSISRDHTGMSMKLAEVGNARRPVVKRSLDAAKVSIPGAVRLMWTNDGGPTVFGKHDQLSPWDGMNGRYGTWYQGDDSYLDGPDYPKNSPMFTPNSMIRERIRSEFLSMPEPKQVLSDEILELRKRCLDSGSWS